MVDEGQVVFLTPHFLKPVLSCRRAVMLGALLACGLTLAAGSVRGEDTAPEAALKAAFVYNFTKFVEWPETDVLSRFSLCTVGGGLTVEALGAFDGKHVQGKPIQVTRKPQGASLRSCQLIFISEAGAGVMPNVLADVLNSATLTVSDHPDFLGSGGVIALVREGGRLRFEVNLGLAQAKGLKVGAPLLRLAKVVRDGR